MKPNYKQIASWVLYDFANTPFPTIVLTFVFSTFFTKFIAKDQVVGTTLWSGALAISGIIIGLFSPIFGAIADQSGRKKPWIFTFASLVILSSFLLAYIPPDSSLVMPILAIVVIGTCCLSFAQVFYNSLLVQVAPQEMIGRISGIGWGCGYFGGLICLIITLGFLIPKDDNVQLLIIGVKGSLILVGVWFFLFALPIFYFSRKTGKEGEF
jgi:UMF1 family MFS transporter